MRPAVAVLLAYLVLPSVAVAEPTRSGLMLGGSLGAGAASACDGCDRLAGPAAELHIGGWLDPNWALSYDVWIFEGDPTHFKLTGQGVGLATVTRRIAPRAWIKGGAGFAMYILDDELMNAVSGSSKTTYRGFALGAASGYELYQSSGSVVVEVAARFAASMFPDHGAALSGAATIGVSWN